MQKRVIVAMSGGVDSSVAAALLKEQGYEVIGVTMCFNLAPKPTDKPSCCGLQGIEDARRVAQLLGIRHYVINLDKEFSRRVIRNFQQEYFKGRTPNPCVRCNQFIKFGILLKKAVNLGAQFLATGHYARIFSSVRGYRLKKARDRIKDQSYFLYRLTQAQLKRIIFPLGGLTKPQVRQLAADLGLRIAQKQDSQEICFLPDGKYGEFIQAADKMRVKPGDFLDQRGKIIGQHRGLVFYTIGQRHGIGISAPRPLYVTRIDPRRNRIMLGERGDVFKKEFFVTGAHFLDGLLKKKIEIKARIRYNQTEAPAVVFPSQGKLKVIFKQAQFAITPGQSAVFYDRDTVIGGGIIQKVID